MNEKEPRTSVTPIKKAISFQKERAKRKKIDENAVRFKSYDVILNGRSLKIKYDSKTDHIVIEGKLYPTMVEEKNGFFMATVSRSDGEDHVYKLEHHDGQIFLEGRIIEFDFKRSIPILKRKKLLKKGKELIRAPLPGKVASITVKVGDQVEAGQRILTLEAMKMQNEITSSYSGKITEIYVKTGNIVGSNDRLVLIDTI